MRTGVLTILILLSLSAIILNVGAVFTEGQITHGQGVYENIREANADSLPITLNQDDGRELVRFIQRAIIQEWRARSFLVTFSFLVFSGLLVIVVVDYHEKAKRKDNESLKSGPA